MPSNYSLLQLLPLSQGVATTNRTLFQPYLRLLGFLQSLVLPNADPEFPLSRSHSRRATFTPGSSNQQSEMMQTITGWRGRREDGSTGVYYQSEGYKSSGRREGDRCGFVDYEI